MGDAQAKSTRARVHPAFKITLGMIILAWVTFFVYREVLRSRVILASRISSPEGIDSLEKIHLGGVDQWILIRGWDRSDPVVLFLHGGPGAPLFPYARDIGIRAGLEKHCIMVYWEQRGTGKSFGFSIPPESMTLDQLVADTRVLAQTLKRRLKVPKIFLVGKSWGSLIGIITVHRYPQLFHAYLGMGQVVNPLEGDRLSYDFALQTARQRDDKRALEELEGIGPPPFSPRNLRIQRSWLTRFDRSEHPGVLPRARSRSSARNRLLATPEYSFWDILKMGADPHFSTRHLWNEKFYSIDLIREVPLLEVPVYFVAGRHDYFTPGAMIEAYVDVLEAPKGKYLVWFDRSGHQPELSEPEKLGDIIARMVKLHGGG